MRKVVWVLECIQRQICCDNQWLCGFGIWRRSRQSLVLMHILFLALHQDHPKSEDHSHSDWQESQHAQNRTVPSYDSELLGNLSSKPARPAPAARLQCTRQEKIFPFPHRQIGAARYFSGPHPPNVPHSVWLWQSALAFFCYRWQTCNRRGGDPVTHVLFDAECVPDAPFFFCRFALFFRSTLAGAQAAWSEKPCPAGSRNDRLPQSMTGLAVQQSISGIEILIISLYLRSCICRQKRMDFFCNWHHTTSSSVTS